MPDSWKKGMHVLLHFLGGHSTWKMPLHGIRYLNEMTKVEQDMETEK